MAAGSPSRAARRGRQRSSAGASLSGRGRGPGVGIPGGPPPVRRYPGTAISGHTEE